MRIFRYLDQSGKMGFGRFDKEGNTFLILQKGDGDFEAPGVPEWLIAPPTDGECPQ